jgi:hypothetical protein
MGGQRIFVSVRFHERLVCDTDEAAKVGATQRRFANPPTDLDSIGGKVQTLIGAHLGRPPSS